MESKPLGSEDEYQAAMKEIERLWDAVPGTAEFDRLDVSAILVEKYESEHHCIEPPKRPC